MDNKPGSMVKADARPMTESDAFVNMVEKFVRDPNVDVVKLKELLAMRRELLEDQARRDFAADMAALQGELPQMVKSAEVSVRGTVQSKYAKLEDIDYVVRPLLTRHHFSVSLDCKPIDGTSLLGYSMTLTHANGHQVTKTLPFPIDKSGNKNDVQSVGSTTSYAQRYLLRMHLNMVERGADDDGRGGHQPPRDEGWRDIIDDAEYQQVQEDFMYVMAKKGAPPERITEMKAKLCKWLKCESLEKMTKAQLKDFTRWYDQELKGVQR